MGVIQKLGSMLGKGGSRDPRDRYLNLVKKEPGNAKAHLKLAEIYQKAGDKKKAIYEYLVAAEIFLKNNFYARAMAIYKQVPKQDPSLDHVYLKIADIYKNMGFMGDAFAQYRILLQHYDSLGHKEKALEVMALMADLDPRKTGVKEKIEILKQAASLPKTAVAPTQKIEPARQVPRKEISGGDYFDLGAELEDLEPAEIKDYKEIATLEKIYGFEEIFKELKETSGPSAVDPNFNYNMGVASREMGFIDDAIEQFQLALEGGQNPFEAANMLGLCYKEKGSLDRAAEALEKAMEIKSVSPERLLEVKYELGLIYREQGKLQEALVFLQQIAEVDKGFRDTSLEIAKIRQDLNSQARFRKR
jgi:tetratricopeptide (TPR) repeat protein